METSDGYNFFGQSNKQTHGCKDWILEICMLLQVIAMQVFSFNHSILCLTLLENLNKFKLWVRVCYLCG
jgi:hypothetical protein